MNKATLEQYQTLPSEEEIAQATYTVFLNGGYDEATVQAVAEHLGLSPEVLQQHHPSKYQLWYSALCQASQGLQAAVESQATMENPLEQLRKYCQSFVAWAQQNPKAYRFLTMPRSDSMPEPDSPAPGVIFFWARMQRVVKRCIQEGIFAEQPADIATQGLWCVLHGVTEMLINIRRIPWVPGLQNQVIETYIAGLCFSRSQRSVT